MALKINPLVTQDKANHDLYGSLTACISCIVLVVLFCFAGVPIWLLYYSIAPTVSFAVLKEVRDMYTNRGTPEMLDIVYTIVGGLKVYIPVVLVVYLLVK